MVHSITGSSPAVPMQATSAWLERWFAGGTPNAARSTRPRLAHSLNRLAALFTQETASSRACFLRRITRRVGRAPRHTWPRMKNRR